MSILGVLANLGPEVEDPAEEAFWLFSQSIPSQNLGFVDPKATTLDITVGSRDFSIHQSPTILASSRNGGTTGAVLWKITPLFATWIASPDNFLFRHHVLSSVSSVVELGCGISGITGITLGSLVRRYTLTDQAYIMKYLNRNLVENMPNLPIYSNKSLKRKSHGHKLTPAENLTGNVMVRSLDWETDEVLTCLAGFGDPHGGFDAIVACDCIYNDVLIRPLVQTCADACRLRVCSSNSSELLPSVCIIAQQLRSADVFEAWLLEFHKIFRVWRVPDAELIKDLTSNSGFVIHLGVLR